KLSYFCIPSCLSEFSPRLAVEEYHVLFDILAADVQLIGCEVWVGVTDRQAAQNRQFRRDSQLRADDLGIPSDRDLDASTQAAFGQGQQQRLQVHPHAEGSAILVRLHLWLDCNHK